MNPRRAIRSTTTLLVLGLALTGTATSAQGNSSSPGVEAAWDFEDGLQGWLVEDEPGSPDTWIHTDVADGSAGAVGLSSYGNNSATLVRSPEFDVTEGSVLEFRASYWIEGCFCDFVQVQVRPVGGDWTLLDTVQGRGRWPLWDHHRYELPFDGRIEVGLQFYSDVGCAGGPVKPHLAELLLNASKCGEGFWFDDVRVAPASQFAEAPAAWGDGPNAHPIVEGSDGSIGVDEHTVEAALQTPPEGFVTRTGTNEYDDQLTNPDFLAALDQTGEIHMDGWWRDPLVDWDGEMTEAWFLNRYDTPLGVRLYAPAAEGRHPLLVFIGALGGAGWTGYDAMIQRLVDEGYVVASIVPQGVGFYSSIRSAVLPAPAFCGPVGDDVWWRRPQEAGLVEATPCAGVSGPFSGGDRHELAAAYREGFGAPFVFSTVDAVDWLLSPSNPWHQRIDRSAGVGAFGNSAGAWAAMIAAQVDDRIGAAAILDGYGLLGEVEPTTPTLTFGYDAYGVTGDSPLNPVEVADAFRAAGIESGYLHHAATGHLDSSWSPYVTGDALVGGLYLASYGCNCKNKLAKPVHQHYLLAWFDRHLKGDATAVDRLTATTFDGSADRTARGTGRYEVGVGNRPYTIEGLKVASTLNDAFPSWFLLEGEETRLGG